MLYRNGINAMGKKKKRKQRRVKWVRNPGVGQVLLLNRWSREPASVFPPSPYLLFSSVSSYLDPRNVHFPSQPRTPSKETVYLDSSIE